MSLHVPNDKLPFSGLQHLEEGQGGEEDFATGTRCPHDDPFSVSELLLSQSL